MSIAKSLITAVGFVTVCGSAGAADAKFGDAGAVLTEETRIYYGPCFFQKPPAVDPKTNKALVPGPFGAILATAGKEAVVDFAVGALKAAGEDKSTQAIAAYPANGWMYEFNESAQLTLNPKYQCIQIVSGSFWNGFRMFGNEKIDAVSPRDTAGNVSLTKKLASNTKDADGNDVKIARWGDSGELFEQLKVRFRQLRWTRFFFEARLDKFSESRAGENPSYSDKIILSPTAMYFQKPVDGSFFDVFGGAKRNILVTLSLSISGSEVGSAFASVNFPFRDVPSGTLLTPLYFEGHSSRAIAAPALTDDEKAIILAKKSKFDAANSDVELVWGTPPQKPYQPSDLEKDIAYTGARTAYCDYIKGLNAAAKKADPKATPIEAAECAFELQSKKANLVKAKEAYDKIAALGLAKDNVDNVWKWPSGAPYFSGVTCLPKAPSTVPVCQLPSATDVRPITVNAAVVEVRQGSKFAAFLGKVLEKAQPAINTAIENSSPEKKAEAAEASKVDTEAYQLTLGDVSVSQAKLDALTAKADSSAADIAQAKQDLLAKKIAANQAARKAGVAEPYTIP